MPEVASPEIGRVESLLHLLIRQAPSKSNLRLKLASWIDKRLPRPSGSRRQTLDRAFPASNLPPCLCHNGEKQCSRIFRKRPQESGRRSAQAPLPSNEFRDRISFHCSLGSECYNCCPMASDPTAQICPGCGTTVDTTEAEPLARIACPTCGKKIRVERTFDHFLVVETLGVGGMGTVYKARDTQLDRFVALKLLRRDLGGEEDHKARLQQEARIAAAVNHPYVIQVFDSGTDHDQFYVVMELVDQGSLDDLMALEPRLPEKRIACCASARINSP
ncbi:MAG: hypothetical protein DME65_09030 [Verrucomicrobia bacterium]|nr:MAG: hypothetical protein DME65_09030 [Verrucomicrobiota bacterium]